MTYQDGEASRDPALVARQWVYTLGAVVHLVSPQPLAGESSRQLSRLMGSFVHADSVPHSRAHLPPAGGGNKRNGRRVGGEFRNGHLLCIILSW